MGADPIPSVLATLAREDRRASPCLIVLGAFTPLRVLKAISVFPPRLRTLTSLSRHKHCGSPTYGQWPVFGTVKADLLMSLHRQRPVELFGPLPSTAPADGAALQPPVGNQQA
jgi:hypothetical protein